MSASAAQLRGGGALFGRPHVLDAAVEVGERLELLLGLVAVVAALRAQGGAAEEAYGSSKILVTHGRRPTRTGRFLQGNAPAALRRIGRLVPEKPGS